MAEKKIEVEFRDECKKLGCKCVKFSDPGEDGAPDRLVLTPWGFPVFVEFKRPGEQPRQNQIRYMHKLCTMGYLAFAANDAATPVNCLLMLKNSLSRESLYLDFCQRQALILKRQMP